jgi:type VI secretion system protein ImpJ
VKAGCGFARLPFAPPAVRLYPDGLLRDTALDVLELLRAKGRELEECKLQATLERPVGFRPADGALALALGVVLRHVARLNGLLAATAHPHAAHAALRELASELGLFAGSGAPDLGPYDHADPGPGFMTLRAAVAGLLEEVSPGPEQTAPFRREGPGVFLCDLPAFPEGPLGFWLIASTGLPPEEAGRAVARDARLAAPGRAEGLAARALPGVGLTPVREAPAGLRRRGDAAFFAIRAKDPLWDEALKAGRLELRWDGAPEGARFMLAAARP